MKAICLVAVIVFLIGCESGSGGKSKAVNQPEVNATPSTRTPTPTPEPIQFTPYVHTFYEAPNKDGAYWVECYKGNNSEGGTCRNTSHHVYIAPAKPSGIEVDWPDYEDVRITIAINSGSRWHSAVAHVRWFVPVLFSRERYELKNVWIEGDKTMSVPNLVEESLLTITLYHRAFRRYPIDPSDPSYALGARYTLANPSKWKSYTVHITLPPKADTLAMLKELYNWSP